MRLKWVVHSGTEILGPWSASRIRDELRSGRIDTFDLVSLVGSSVKRPLMEVDEIFETSRIQAAAFATEATRTEKLPAQGELRVLRAAAGEDRRPQPKPQARESSAQSDFKAESAPTPPSDSIARPRAFEALASPAGLSPPARHTTPVRKVSATSGTRRYVLTTPDKKAQGPFSSKEVLTLWYADRLHPATLVQRIGHPKQVQIARFVGFYERAEPSGIAFIVGTRMAEQARDRSHWWLISALLIAAALVLGSLAYRAGRVSRDSVRDVISILHFKSEPSPAKEKPKKIVSEPPVPDSFDPVVVMPNPVPPSPQVTERRPERIQGSALKPSPPPKAAVSVNRSASYSRPRAEKTVPRKNPPQYLTPRIAAPKLQPVAPVKPPQARPASVTGQPQKKPTALVDGAQVTLSGYHFNPTLLNSCSAKCKIPMTGPQGPVTAVFFKEAFASELTQKSGGVTIIGTVRKDAASGSIQIFVQSVR